MKECPECTANIDDSAKECPICGKKVIPANQLEKIMTVTTTWQKVCIVVGAIIIIAIACTFLGAGSREQQAAQNIFEPSVSHIIQTAAEQTGMAHAFGMPRHLLRAGTKSAEIRVHFPTGPMDMRQARRFGERVCAIVANTYVRKGYIPRALEVTVSSASLDGRNRIYGIAYYDGDTDKLSWEPAQ